MFVDALAPLVPRHTPLERSYELIDASIFHILHLANIEKRKHMTRSAFRELLLNRDLDHVPRNIGHLAGYLDVSDPESVLDLALRGRTMLFAGFHTGPYWAIFQTLVEKGLHVTTLFPSVLESRRQEACSVFAALTKHFGSGSTLELISLEDPGFLVRVRSSTSAGRTLVVFLDGNSGVPAQANNRRDVHMNFFHAKITVKSTILRLADILSLPLVTFNAVRCGIKRTLLLDPPLSHGTTRRYDETIHMVFSRLMARLEQEPGQWEGWLYFHTYFSTAYRSTLASDTLYSELTDLPLLSRYFIQGRGDQSILFDKQTYKRYRVTTREGVQA